MTTRSARIFQTSTEAKKAHKRNAGQLPQRQQRQLERAAELDRRASDLRDRAERSKAAKKKREEKQRKEIALRKQNGVGLATQLLGYSHTQAQLKNGMETFLGLKKKCEEDRKRESDVIKQLEAVVEEAAAMEPWDDDDALEAFDPSKTTTKTEEQWIDEDIDDDTLLELHDKIVPEPIEENIQASPPAKPETPAPIAQSTNVKVSKADQVFDQIHGPIDEAIEAVLDQLPDDLIQLLSQDCSSDPLVWDPSPALLHKLQPPGLPPHRLRIKVGCVVALLRDLNISSQLSKSQHLQILRVEHERLQCLVLDGQLEGTKTFLTRIHFPAKYGNEYQCSYRRLQFPIEVSKDYAVPVKSRTSFESGFKRPTLSGRGTQLSAPLSKNIPATPKPPKLNRNPSFKMPGLPASRVNPPVSKPPTLPPPLPDLCSWDDFLDSSTQIARDLSSETSSSSQKSPLRPPQITPAGNSHMVPSENKQSAQRLMPAKLHATTTTTANTNNLPPISTQDFDFSLDELDNSPALETCKAETSKPLPTGHEARRHPTTNYTETRSTLNKTKSLYPVPAARPVTPQTSAHQPLKRKAPDPLPRPTSPIATRQYPMAPPERPQNAPAPNSVVRPTITPKTTNIARQALAAKPVNCVSARHVTQKPQARPCLSISDFGLSTQEAVSFFDDADF